MTKNDRFADWLRNNPAPDLQDLVVRFGGYANITAESWAEYDRAMAAWQEARKNRRLAEVARAPDPEAVCPCGLAGLYMRPRKGGGPPIWRCEEHRRHWPDYAEDVPWKRAGAS